MKQVLRERATVRWGTPAIQGEYSRLIASSVPPQSQLTVSLIFQLFPFQDAGGGRRQPGEDEVRNTPGVWIHFHFPRKSSLITVGKTTGQRKKSFVSFGELPDKNLIIENPPKATLVGYLCTNQHKTGLNS